MTALQELEIILSSTTPKLMGVDYNGRDVYYTDFDSLDKCKSHHLWEDLKESFKEEIVYYFTKGGQ